MSHTRPLLRIALYSLLLLTFLQLLSDFVEAIYVFGLLGTNIPPEIACVLLFLSPLLLLLLPRGLRGWPLLFVGYLMLLSRIAEPLLDPRGKMLISGLGVASGLLLLPSLLLDRLDNAPDSAALDFGLGLILALLSSILLRTWGSGSDISTRGVTAVLGWILALSAGLLLPIIHQPQRTAPPAPAAPHGLSASHTIGLSLGLMGVLVLAWFGWMSPTVISRWTGASYPLILSAVVFALVATGLIITLRPSWLSRQMALPTLVPLNVAFTAYLALTLLRHQIPFPPTPASYPLAEPPVTWMHHVPLAFTLLLWPVLLLDAIALVRALVRGRPSPRALAAGFSVASFYLLLMVFAQIFTTVYDYIPVVGPLFRDRFWLVFVVAALVPMMAVRLTGRSSTDPTLPNTERTPRAFPVALIALAILTLAGLAFTSARPTAAPSKRSLTILTYNIQQGYSKAGAWAYDDQLDEALRVHPDLIGLQECDTARIANGNADVVRYWADRLNMYSYYGPKTVPGTFGIALLSRYPIQNARTFYMYSEGEQTAAIEANITVGDRTFTVFVTHLGNGGPLVQQQAVLQEVRGKQNVLLMGDFNFRPDTEQYRHTVALLDDAWVLRWPEGNSSQGVDFARTIDHIFVSPGTRVTEARYLPGPASDHPAEMAVIEW